MGIALVALATAIFLLIEGACMLRAGTLLRWGRPEGGSQSRLSKPRRVAYAALLLVSGGSVLAVLLSAAAARDLKLSELLRSIAQAWQPLLLGLFVVGVGLRAMINPTFALRTARYTHPEIDEYDPVARRVARLIGLVGFLIGAIFLLVALS